MQKVKDGDVHKVKADVTRKVIGGIRLGDVPVDVLRLLEDLVVLHLVHLHVHHHLNNMNHLPKNL